MVELTVFVCTGSVYLYDCPYERYIPIYLIIGGCLGIIKDVSNMLQRACNMSENRDENARTNPFDSMLLFFMMAWFIAGLSHNISTTVRDTMLDAMVVR